MSDWFRKKEDSPPSPKPAVGLPVERGEPLIAALLLDSKSFGTAAAKQAIESSSIGDVAATNVNVKGEILSFDLSDDMFFVAPMGAPYPWFELEGPCHTSWMWPRDNPALNLKSHASHVLVTNIGGTGNAIWRRLQLTRVTSRLAKLDGVVGIYWPEATLVHFPPVFTAMAAKATRKAPPLYLWVDFRAFFEQAGTTVCFTTGLSKLGLMELEITALTMSPSELRDWTISVAAYMYERGSVIPDGDTIGVSAEQRLRVSHGPSRFGLPGKVVRFSA